MFLQCILTIISYRVVEIMENSITSIYSTVYAVLEITDRDTNTLFSEVDESLFWTNSLSDDE